MRRLAILCRVAAMTLALTACDGADWSSHGGTIPVSNASNGQPMPTSAYPRGASSYGNPPNAMALPKTGLTQTYGTGF